MRLFSTAINLIKDANPRVVVLSLDCLALFLDKYLEHFQPMINLTFTFLTTKLGDSKVRNALLNRLFFFSPLLIWFRYKFDRNHLPHLFS
jgi:hypothetical protein